VKDGNIVSVLSEKLLKNKRAQKMKDNAVRLPVRCTCIQNNIISRTSGKRIKRKKKLNSAYFGFTYHTDVNISPV